MFFCFVKWEETLAITRIWTHKRFNQRENQSSDSKKSVSDGIYYVMNPDKTTEDGKDRLLAAEEDSMKSLDAGLGYAMTPKKQQCQ